MMDKRYQNHGKLWIATSGMLPSVTREEAVVACPNLAAAWSGVQPSSRGISGDAPLANRSSTTCQSKHTASSKFRAVETMSDNLTSPRSSIVLPSLSRSHRTQ